MKLQKFRLGKVFLCVFLLALSFSIQASEVQQKASVKEFNETDSSDSLVTYTTSILWSEISNVFVEGNYAYCAFVNGLGIIDVSDSTNPFLVSTVFFPGRGEGIFVQDGLAYLADGYFGLQIIDVSDPLYPTPRGRYDSPGYSWDVFVKGNYAYLADDWCGVFIVDVSNPDNPEPVWNYDTRDYPRDIFVQENYAYVADSYGGLFILDVSDPTNPDTLGRYSDSLYSFFAQGLFVRDTLAYVANRWSDYGLEIINVKNPNQPQKIGSYPISGEEVFVRDSLAFVVTGGWLDVISLVSPSDPELVGVFNMHAYTFGVWVKNNLVYVTKCTDHNINWFYDQEISGFEIIDTKYTPYIHRRGSLDTPWVKQVFIQDSLAYVLVKNELKICNISDPSKPEVIGSCPTSNSASKIFVEGDIAGIVDSAGLQVFYMKNPSLPFWVGSYPTSGSIKDIFIKDTLAYMLKSKGGSMGQLRILNVANPLEPESIGTYSLYVPKYYFSSIFVMDSLAYIGDGDEGLYIVSISDPRNPYLIGSWFLPFDEYADIVVKDGFAYTVSEDHDLIIFDVSEPDSPRYVTYMFLPIPYWDSSIRSISIKDSLAYIPAGDIGLLVISIKDPYHPYLVTMFDTPGFALDAFLTDDNIYVADKYSLMVLESHFVANEVKEVADEENIPVAYSLSQNYPNPFNPETNIEFIIPKSVQVKLEIFNILGQKIRTLVDQQLKAGHKVVDWDGRDDLGKEVSSGMYFYRIMTPEFSQTKKMVLLR